MTAEKREELRDCCAIRARIISGYGADVVECLVTDISERGARLQVDAGYEIPPSFLLAIPALEGVFDERRAELRWQYGQEGGVRFVGSSKPA